MTTDSQPIKEGAGEEFSFVTFSKAPFYQEINASLVNLSQVHPGQHVIDLACGTGGVTKLIQEKLRGAKESLIIGVDLSASALKQARLEVENAKSAMVLFVQGHAEQLSKLINDSVDAVVFCNAIHMVKDKTRLMGEISHTLRSGGVLAFNTSFFEGSHPPETEQWYRKWLFRSLRILRSEYGLSPIKEERVESRVHLSPEEYVMLLEKEGFQIREQRINTIQVPLEGWVLISEFEDWIRGVMPGVPLKEASESLKKAAAQVFQEMNVKFIPRNWMEVVAARV